MDKQPEVIEKSFAQKMVFFFLEKKDLLFWIVSAILLVSLVVFQVISFIQRSERKAKVEFETTYLEWTKDKKPTTFAKLETLLQKHSSIARSYQGMLVQKGLEEGYLGILPLAKQAMNDGAPSLYSEFGKISLLMMENKLAKALESSYVLKSELVKKKDMETLTAFTMLRIAGLEKSLGQKEKEKKAWEALEVFLASHKENASIQLFLSNFRKGQDVDLADYVTYRKSLLK
ncbi:MAG: hypothetical protein WCP39_00020 [Chlamydiota bacterium]